MKLGKWELNKCYCEDSYKAIKEIPDNSIDCIYTDIPYLYNQGGSGSSALGERTAKKRLELMGLSAKFMENEGKSRGEALRIAKNVKRNDLERTSIEDGIDYAILDEFVRVMKKVNIFIWCSKLQILDIMNYFVGKLGCFFEILTWNKTNPTPTTNNSWLPDIEYCLYFREKGVPLNDGYEFKSKYYISPANVGDKEKFTHPTAKPVPLVKRHLQHTTQEGDIVADFFVGGGTTCVACKDLNRNYIGFDIVEKYVKIANDRLNNVDAYGQTSMFLR